MNDISQKAANNLRILSLAMVEKAKSGHPGGALGGADFIHILFTEFLNFDPDNPHWKLRDRFLLDPGHMSPLLYSVLFLCEKYSLEDIKQFRQWKSNTPGHPELDISRGIENTSGPLGQGHTMAVGIAIAERFLCARFGETLAHKTFAYLSDGSVQEGISQGTGRLAGKLGLHNLVMFYDANKVQLSTMVEQVSDENTAQKYDAWGWSVHTIDGNNREQIRQALHKAVNEKEKPTLIIGNTEMAKGAVDKDGNPLQNKIATHGQPLSRAGACIDTTIKNLGGTSEAPFQIFHEVKEYYKTCLNNKRTNARERENRFNRWEKENPQKAEKLHKFFAKDYFPDINFSEIPFDKNVPTRNVSYSVLAKLSSKTDNMIVGSADLCNSDKTDGFLKHTKPFDKGDFTGAFLQAGVNEFTLASICNGIALHGGVIAACGTFFVFSDYMKPAIRMSALMQLPVKYIFSHDSFRVGEDGPTHQPVEQEVQLRLLEKMKNHSGNPAMLVLRPADGAETLIAWEMAMKNTGSPTALLFTRQKVNDILGMGHRIKEASKAKKGGYVVLNCDGNPDIILVGNGSEVATLVETAMILKKNNNIKCSVVSIISDNFFLNQPLAYRKNIIPTGVPIFALTAGLPLMFQRIVQNNGKIYGLEHFGYSAPFGVLEEKFGFTASHIAREVHSYLTNL